jgi:hypothetical protein
VRAALALGLCATALATAGCGVRPEEPEEREFEARLAQDPIRIGIPGAHAIILETGARVFVFVEREAEVDGSRVELSDDVAFRVTITNPRGTLMPPEPDLVAPKAWRDDAGVRSIAAFTAPIPGGYQIEVATADGSPTPLSAVLLPVQR